MGSLDPQGCRIYKWRLKLKPNKNHLHMHDDSAVPPVKKVVDEMTGPEGEL